MIVQHIDVGWTKAGRGGRLAEARSAVPEGFPLPPLPASFDPRPQSLIHRILYGESNAFAAPLPIRCLSTEAVLRGTAIALPNVILDQPDPDDEAVHVKFEWRDGTPRRRKRDRRLNDLATLAEFDVRPGEWARVVFNARYTDRDCGHWSYARHTINVAAVEPFTNDVEDDLFLDTEPATEVRNLARLW